MRRPNLKTILIILIMWLVSWHFWNEREREQVEQPVESVYYDASEDQVWELSDEQMLDYESEDSAHIVFSADTDGYLTITTEDSGDAWSIDESCVTTGAWNYSSPITLTPQKRPSNPSEGMIYYDKDINALCMYGHDAKWHIIER